MNKILFVVAHADDEILGAGATIQKFIKSGKTIAVLVMSTKSHTREAEETLLNKLTQIHKELGIKTYLGNYETENLGFEKHQNLIKTIENAIIDFEPDAIFTHHYGDLHFDHRITSYICQEAVRLPQRQIKNINKIKKVCLMEVNSSSDWNFTNKFKPNYFQEITKEQLEEKIRILKKYENVIRKHPHCRSIEALTGLATIRGSQAGYNYAEAFETIFELGE